MKILIVSAAPQGTLGDPALCKNAIEAIRKKYPDVEITLMIGSIEQGEPNVQKVNNIFKGMSRVIILYYKGGANIDKEEAKDYDMILAFPFQILGEQVLENLEEIHQENIREGKHGVIFLTSYDMDFKYEETARGFSIIKNVPYLKLGIGENKAGIFIPNLSDNSNVLSKKETAIKEMNSHEQKTFDLFCKGNLETQLSQDDFYFGYNNKIPGVDVSWINASRFITLCLLNSKKDTATIFLNVGKNGVLHDPCNIDTIFEHLSRIGISLIKDYEFQYFALNDQQDYKLETSLKAGAGKKICRIINPFPLSPKIMQFYLAISKLLTFQTGNSSILEALAAEKIPVYQITAWSIEFYKGLIWYVEDKLGPQSIYAQFLKMTAPQYSNVAAGSLSALGNFYNINEMAILEEMKKLKTALMKEKDKNLHQNFLPKLEQLGVKFPSSKEIGTINTEINRAVTVDSLKELLQKRDFEKVEKMLKDNEDNVDFLNGIYSELSDIKYLVQDPFRDFQLLSQINTIFSDQRITLYEQKMISYIEKQIASKNILGKDFYFWSLRYARAKYDSDENKLLLGKIISRGLESNQPLDRYFYHDAVRGAIKINQDEGNDALLKAIIEKSKQSKLYLGKKIYILLTQEAIKQGNLSPVLDIINNIKNTKHKKLAYLELVKTLIVNGNLHLFTTLLHSENKIEIEPEKMLKLVAQTKSKVFLVQLLESFPEDIEFSDAELEYFSSIGEKAASLLLHTLGDHHKEFNFKESLMSFLETTDFGQVDTDDDDAFEYQIESEEDNEEALSSSKAFLPAFQASEKNNQPQPQPQSQPEDKGEKPGKKFSS